MHILIQTQYYTPEIGAPQARLSELARGLVKYGFTVTVLTAMPNYPHGKIYPGYGGWVRSEMIDGIRVIRTWIFPSQKASILPRLLNYFSFVFSSLLFGIWFVGKPDVILTESPPLFLGISGYLISRLKRARWIFNVSDLWPQSAIELGVINKGGVFHRMASWLESFFYRKAWAVSGQSKGILRSICSRFPQVRTVLISNGVDTQMFHPNGGDQNAKKILGDGEIVLYAGLHGLAQGLEQVLLAARQTQDLTQLKYVFIGDGPEKRNLVQKSREMGLNNVRFLDSLPREQIPALLASADICLVPLKIHLTGAVPSKLYEAMASGKPVLLIAEGEPAEIVTRYQAGIAVLPGDINSLVDGVRRLHGDPDLRLKMGLAGRTAAVDKFDRGKIIQSFAQFIKSELT